MLRQHYTTIVISPDSIGGKRSTFSDYAEDETDLFRQYAEIFNGWSLINKDEATRTYTITYERIR